MIVTIKALQPLADRIGGKKIEMEWPGGTLEDLIRFLIEKNVPELAKELKAEDDSLAYLVSVNGKIHRKLSIPIQDGDEIFFFTPLGGG